MVVALLEDPFVERLITLLEDVEAADAVRERLGELAARARVGDAAAIRASLAAARNALECYRTCGDEHAAEEPLLAAFELVLLRIEGLLPEPVR